MKKLILPPDHWNQLRFEVQVEFATRGGSTLEDFANICSRRYQELYNNYEHE